ncbi:hypothetical protein K32_28540 [Kaistia sp. 32K]|uniref:hypothetical protein n=1 Tax=Kaistia sp. 32K TaxID=2795690 RepID=UPI001916B72F|nr:hypothetical protein [Kaistia sp. 32K]BCP54237.1 hypothetical protein K32_28540 [Kaistia sp. 32K]
MHLPVINALWIGPSLGPMHAACLHSFQRAGHRVRLHVYEDVAGVPKGIELSDGNDILPRSSLVRHTATGSYAIASDLFRYELLAADLGVYADCDCYCIRPIEDAEYIMGWEDGAHICSALLRMPADSELLRELRSIGKAKAFIPPWFDKRRKRRLRMRALLGAPVQIADMPWGTVGPVALTYYARKHSVDVHVLAADILYGLAPSRANLLLDPGLKMEDFLTPRTKVVHLWNEHLRHLCKTPPAGSPLEALVNEGKQLQARQAS